MIANLISQGHARLRATRKKITHEPGSESPTFIYLSSCIIQESSTEERQQAIYLANKKMNSDSKQETAAENSISCLKHQHQARALAFGHFWRNTEWTVF
jgi:hypothetical protein